MTVTRCARGGKKNGDKVLPFTLTSVPGRARIWSTVSTWFLLHARWRRVSPSNQDAKRRDGRRRERGRRAGREGRNPELGCVQCPAHCPLPHGEQTNKTPQICPQTLKERRRRKKKKNAWPTKSATRQWGCDLRRMMRGRGEIFQGKDRRENWANSPRLCFFFLPPLLLFLGHRDFPLPRQTRQS